MNNSWFRILLALHVMVAAGALGGCVLKRGVDFAGIASRSSDTLGDVSSLEGRIMQSDLTDTEQDTALDRAGQIRAMVLAVDLALVMAAGETYDHATSSKINAAAKTAHRHMQAFVNRPAAVFARSALNAPEWDAFESEADALLGNLRQQLGR